MEDLGLGAGLVAIAFWGFFSVVVVAGIWDRIRKREAQHETVRSIIESGKPMDQSTMDKLLSGNKDVARDLKVAGLITLSVAPGLALLGWFLGQIAADVLPSLLGVSLLVRSLLLTSAIAG